jgi:hypothetical protein
MGSKLAVLCALLALAASATALASAPTTTINVYAGAVGATFIYRHNAANQVEPFSSLRLTIRRAGKTAYSAPVTNPTCGRFCSPTLPNPVSLKDLEGDGRTEVLLNLYSGGAHCCYLSEVFSYSAARGRYQTVLHDWGDPGFRLAKLDDSRPYEWLTADDSFAYEFAAFAFSGLPLQILRLVSGHFVDLTRHYPALITRDAATQWKNYLENRGGGTGLGFLAAWAADEYNLGRERRVTSTLASLDQSHELRGIDPATWPTGAKFVVSLESFLAKSGYAG